MRGKNFGTIIDIMGTVSVSSIQYEHVIISEVQHAVYNTITVAFKNDDCRSVTHLVAPAP